MHYIFPLFPLVRLREVAKLGSVPRGKRNKPKPCGGGPESERFAIQASVGKTRRRTRGEAKSWLASVRQKEAEPNRDENRFPSGNWKQDPERTQAGNFRLDEILERENSRREG